MDPQNNTQNNVGAQPQQDPNAQSSDGFGGSAIAYANYNDQIARQQTQPQDPGAVPMNVVDVVNANGVVSGKKVVDYIWQRIAVCMIALAVGLMIGLAIVSMIAISKSADMAKMEVKKESIEGELRSIYGKLGVNDLSGAISRLEATEMMDGGDLAKVNDLLAGKFGANYKLDLADHNINFVVRNGVYKIVSLGIYRESGTRRVVLYERIADGKWILGGFDASKDDACADSTDEEKEAIRNVIPCKEDEEE